MPNYQQPLSPIPGAPGLGGYISEDYVFLEMEPSNTKKNDLPKKGSPLRRSAPRSHTASKTVANTTPVSKLAMNNTSWCGEVATPAAPPQPKPVRRKRRLKEITNSLFDFVTGGGGGGKKEEEVVVNPAGSSSSSPPAGTSTSSTPKRAKVAQSKVLAPSSSSLPPSALFSPKIEPAFEVLSDLDIINAAWKMAMGEEEEEEGKGVSTSGIPSRVEGTSKEEGLGGNKMKEEQKGKKEEELGGLNQQQQPQPQQSLTFVSSTTLPSSTLTPTFHSSSPVLINNSNSNPINNNTNTNNNTNYITNLADIPSNLLLSPTLSSTFGFDTKPLITTCGDDGNITMDDWLKWPPSPLPSTTIASSFSYASSSSCSVASSFSASNSTMTFSLSSTTTSTPMTTFGSADYSAKGNRGGGGDQHHDQGGGGGEAPLKMIKSEEDEADHHHQDDNGEDSGGALSNSVVQQQQQQQMPSSAVAYGSWMDQVCAHFSVKVYERFIYNVFLSFSL